MDDCFSLPNAAKLVAKMRDYADTADDNIYGICVNTPNVLRQAADAIEQLLAENAKLKEELDSAIEDLNFGRCCTTCLHRKKKSCPPNKCLNDENLHWEWRGVKEKEDD